jgi:hypothetical protein
VAGANNLIVFESLKFHVDSSGNEKPLCQKGKGAYFSGTGANKQALMIANPTSQT